ncbi:hypothetical protein [Herbidospora yilanensis]|uniref:hypothetical protein n=1 Tax=Herbidospora yilanensis TaxID=354426 RepID=UPI000785ADA1|nr:hypothetical protein [Herbidospora yilanensis]
MRVPRNVRLIVYCFAFILFLFFTVSAGISQDWILFLVGMVVTGLAATCALVVGEWFATHRERAGRPRAKSEKKDV